MKISYLKVYDLKESILASGFPMLNEFKSACFCQQKEKHLKRAFRLADNPPGSGHDNFLSGILVSMNITATVKWWEQFQRYHFKQIVSSMSTMHKLKEMIENETIKFNPKTSKKVIEAYLEEVKAGSMPVEEMAYSCPMGLELTARVATNYLQLKTICRQRKNHKLEEWHVFCGEVKKRLPLAEALIFNTPEDQNEQKKTKKH